MQNQICNSPSCQSAPIIFENDSDNQAPGPPPNSQELGDRAYALAQLGDYELVEKDQALYMYLTQHCILCNKFVHSSKVYTSHMRHYYQAALISLGSQRCKQYNAMISPVNSASPRRGQDRVKKAFLVKSLTWRDFKIKSKMCPR